MGKEAEGTHEAEVRGNEVTALPSHQDTAARWHCSEANPEESKIHGNSHTSVEQGTVAGRRTVPHVCSAGHNNQTNHTVNNELESVVESTTVICKNVSKEDGEMVTVELGEAGAGSSDKTITTQRTKEDEPEDKASTDYQQHDGEDALDGGWGYVVIVGGFIIMNSLGIISVCYSILFLEFMNDMHASSATVSTIYNVECFTWGCTNILTGPLTEVYGWRRVAFTAGLLTFLGMGASAFATSASFLFFSFSLVTGLGLGMSTFVSFIIMPHYFKRRIGLANALMSAGLCFGGILFPPIITFLQGEYGFRGTTLITAAFMLNNCVAAMVFHPVQWHKKKSSSDASETLTGANKCVKVKKKYSPSKVRPLSGSVECVKCVKLDMEDEATACAGPCTTRAAKDTDITGEMVSERQRVSNNDKEVEEEKTIPPQMVTEINSPQTTKMKTLTVTRAAQQKKPGFWQAMKLMVSALVHNIGILRSPTALLICIVASCIFSTNFNVAMMVPFALEANDYTGEEVSWVVSISHILNLVSRLVVSPLADLPQFRIRLMYMVGLVFIATGTVGVCLVEGLVWVSVMLGLWGFGVGISMTMYQLHMIECMGVKKHPATMGVSGMVSGVWLLVSGPLFGVIRDVSGSYNVALCSYVVMPVISFSCLLILPLVQAYDTRKEQHQREEEKRKKEEEEEKSRMGT